MYRECPKCGQQVADAAEQTCGRCGLIFAKYMPPRPRSSASNNGTPKGAGKKLKSLVLLGAVAAGAWWFGRTVIVPSDPAERAQKFKETVNASVIQQATREYQLVAANGTKIEKCVHAGLVANAYLNAMEEGEYKTWVAVKKRDCEEAGVPQ